MRIEKMKINGERELKLSGERIIVEYSIHTTEESKAWEIARLTCVEQTVEFPEELIPEGDIRSQIIGHIENLRKIEPGKFLASISYANETTAYEIPQLLNVLYGNICMAEGVRVEDVYLNDGITSRFKGPRFGLTGIRDKLGVHNRPMLCAVLKPMGLSPEEFGQMAYELAYGGIDIIKDDHGLADQPFGFFNDRVKCVVDMVQKANDKSGNRCAYMPNINTRADKIVERARFAKTIGADGLMLLPGILGWDFVRMLAEDDELAMPILAHPALLGGYIKSTTIGISTSVLCGILPRLTGVDITLFQNFIGRLTNSKPDCLATIKKATMKMGSLKPSFPSTGGGVTLKILPEFADVYKKDIIYILGGGLHHGDSLIETCHKFREMIS